MTIGYKSGILNFSHQNDKLLTNFLSYANAYTYSANAKKKLFTFSYTKDVANTIFCMCLLIKKNDLMSRSSKIEDYRNNNSKD